MILSLSLSLSLFNLRQGRLLLLALLVWTSSTRDRAHAKRLTAQDAKQRESSELGKLGKLGARLQPHAERMNTLNENTNSSLCEEDDTQPHENDDPLLLDEKERTRRDNRSFTSIPRAEKKSSKAGTLPGSLSHYKSEERKCGHICRWYHGEDACKEKSDPRKKKVKEERKLRKEAEKARVEEGTADLMNKLDLDGDEDLKKDALEALEQFTNAKM